MGIDHDDRVRKLAGLPRLGQGLPLVSARRKAPRELLVICFAGHLYSTGRFPPIMGCSSIRLRADSRGSAGIVPFFTGVIAAGKAADFTLLDQDPTKVEPNAIHAIPVR